MTPLLTLALMCLGIVAVSVLGGSLVLASPWTKKHLDRFIGFGAGAMLGAAFLHMLPEAAALAGPKLGVMALAGFLSLFILERFVLAHPCEEQGCDYHGVGLAAFLGMSFHNLVEGFSLGSGASQTRELGLAVFLAIVVHKLPNAMALAVLLRAGGYPKARTFGLLIGFALMIPLGAGGAYFAFASLSEQAVGMAIAAAAGTFLHVAASDLLPEVHRAADGRWENLISFGAGLALMGLTLLAHDVS